MKKAIVLLSTYNGERFLREQLDSVLNQIGLEIHLLVRDDGSTDSTVTILKEYQSHGMLTWYTGANLGPAQSFMHLLAHAKEFLHLSGKDDCLYAFCDQDDVWDNDKLQVAASKMDSSKERPAFYASQTRSVDTCLQSLPTPVLTPLLTQEESLIYSFVTGCTVVMNATMRDMVLKGQMPKRGVLHDGWCYMIAQAVGAYVVFDPTPHISYRQHEHNVVGLVNSPIHEWKQRVKRVLYTDSGIRSEVATFLLQNYKKWMDAESQQVVQKFIDGKKSFMQRLKLLTSRNYVTGDARTTLYFRIALLLNTY